MTGVPRPEGEVRLKASVTQSPTAAPKILSCFRSFTFTGLSRELAEERNYAVTKSCTVIGQRSHVMYLKPFKLAFSADNKTM